MTYRLSRYWMLASTAILLLLPPVLGGCQAQQVGNKPGEDLNPIMGARQRSAIMKHKARDEAALQGPGS